MKKSIKELFLGALLLRLLIVPLYHHGDADSFFYWAKYLWEKKDFLFFLGKAVPNAAPAAYPPLFYYLLFVWRGFYELIGRLIWWINIKILLFPSNLVLWYQGYGAGVAFNKIPAILADLGCAYLIFKIAKKMGAKEKLAKFATILFLFLPATWYNSAYWGQIESLYSLFVLLSFYLTVKEEFLLGIFSLGISALIKPTGLFVLPVFLIYILKKKRILDLVAGTGFLIILANILYFPFFPLNTLYSAASFYFTSFRGELDYLVSNAFNFWALIFGFNQRPDVTTFWGVPFRLWGFLLFSLSATIIGVQLWKKTKTKQLILAAFLCAFAGFLFLPRMHERYFYTTLIFLAVLAGVKKEWLYSFITLSIIHFLNLYHFWWQPRIPILISFLSNMTVLRGIIIINIGIFLYFFLRFIKDGSFDYHY